MRMLGVDFGSKRIGIAVGESEHAVTTARPCLAASGSLTEDARAISALARSEEVDAIVVGVPRNPEGSNRMEGICLKLAHRISEEGWPVHTVNEAFTSLESEKNLKNVYKRSRLQKRIDGEAARLILEHFFHAQR